LEIKFDDIIQEILFKVGLKYCYYDDPENPEFSKEINKYIDSLKERYLMKDKQAQRLADSLLKAANNYQALSNMLGRLLEDVENENQNERGINER